MPLSFESFDFLYLFFWILVRVSIIFFLMPLFGASGVPALWKAGTSFVISIVLIPVVPPPEYLPISVPELILGVACEALVGLILALGIKILLASVQLAGQFMSFQMGFSMARAMDPQTGAQSTVLTQFLYLFTILFFLSIDGHHIFIRALAASFRLIPPGTFSFNQSISEILIKASGHMFLIGLKIAAPIMVALFLSNLCLGIIARTVPQVNILMIGFPINISIGLIVFIMIIVNISPLLSKLTRSMGELLYGLLNLM